MPHICYDRILPRDLQRFGAMTPAGAGAARLAALISKQWVNGSTLRIKFIGGTPAQHALVKQYAVEWCEFANLKFVFGDDPASEIRIAFNEHDGAWSYPGLDCLEIPRDQPTMNLGWVDRGVILHEFGHAIACIHEHQNPSGGINWNKEQVYADLSGPPNNWDRATIDHNIFDKYATNQINGTVMDADSVMMYSFPASWTTDGWHTDENKVLSQQDKAFIGSAKMYPKLVDPVVDNIIPVSFVVEKAASIAVAGEEDLYLLKAEKDGRYTVQTHGDTDCFMSVYGPSSKTALIARDDDSGVDRNALLELDLKAGEYWVSVRHYSKRGKGDYRISATASSGS